MTSTSISAESREWRQLSLQVGERVFLPLLQLAAQGGEGGGMDLGLVLDQGKGAQADQGKSAEAAAHP